MTTEFTLLLAIYGTILLAAFSGDRGPIGVFKDSTPRLGAKVERQISVGHGFTRESATIINWNSDGEQ